jgi:carbon-monoxide dehydrogenase large subunit
VRGLTVADDATGQGNCAAEWTFGAEACEVRVERATGRVEVTNFAASLDVGRVINPRTARGQVAGGVVQGLGAALKEEVLFAEDGSVANPVIGRYAIPTVRDAPARLTVELLESPQPDGPFGARAMAEHPIVAVAPAVLNAVQDATGVELFRVPVRPSELKAAMDAAGKGGR